MHIQLADDRFLNHRQGHCYVPGCVLRTWNGAVSCAQLVRILTEHISGSGFQKLGNVSFIPLNSFAKLVKSYRLSEVVASSLKFSHVL